MRKIYTIILILIACFPILAPAQITGTWAQQGLLSFGYNANNWVQFVDAVDSNVCWGLSADRAGQTNPLQEIINTIDGGTTWNVHPITNAAGTGPSCIMALDANTAWVAMFNTTGGGGKILKTTDSGVTWTWQSTAVFSAPTGFPNIVHFFDANNGICMGDPNGGYFEIYTTVDGGTTWVRTPQANIPANNVGEFGITDVYAAYGTSTLWFGTNNGRFYKTVDAGLNWTVASSPYTGFIGGIGFKDANYGLATEADLATTNTDMIVTTDGGATWNILPCITGNVGQKQNVNFVPGTDSTWVFTSPYNRVTPPVRDFGSGFSTTDGKDWYMIDQGNAAALHSDNDFTGVNGGWTGGLTKLDSIFNFFRDPVMFKWTGQLYIPLKDVKPISIDNLPAFWVTAGINPIATIENNSLYKGPFNVTLTIPGGYSSTKSVTIPNVQATAQVTFDPWIPAIANNYILTVQTQLAGDEDTTNDAFLNDLNALNEFQNYGWTSFGPLDTSRFGLAGAFNYTGVFPNGNGDLFALGGANQTIRASNNTFDPNTNTWGDLTPMDSVRYEFSAHAVNGKIYVGGGYKGGFTPEQTMGIYDIASSTWTNGPDMPLPVGDYASGVYKDSLIYYIGGFDGGGDQNSVQIYNTYTDTWTAGTAKPGTSTSGLRGGIFDNKIVVTGGYSQLQKGPIREAWLGTINTSNPSNITWTSIPDYPGKEISRLGAGVPYGGTIPMITFEGGDPTGQGMQVYPLTIGYDLNLNEWLIGPDKPTPVSNMSDFVGAVYNDSLWMAATGGYDGISGSGISVNEWLNMGKYVPLAVHSIPTSQWGNISLYPNPTTHSISVRVEKWNDLNALVITDISGREVMKINSTFSSENQVDVSVLSQGMYFIRLEGAGGKNSEPLKFSKL